MDPRSKTEPRGSAEVLLAALLCLGLALLCAGRATSQDTLRVLRGRTVLYQTVLVPETVTVTVRDTVRVPVPCPSADTIFRAAYVSGMDAKLGTPAALAELDYARQEGFTYLDLYGLGGVLGNATKEAQLAAWIKEAHARGVQVGATGGSGSSWTSRAKYNRSRRDPAERFDGFNLEYEYWNDSDVVAGFARDSAYLVQMDTTARNLQLRGWCQYVGWYPAPLQRRAPELLLARTTYQLLHYYRSRPEAAYGKVRLDSLEALAARRRTPARVRALFSAEPAFMQTYFRTASVDSAWRAWRAQVLAYGYRWLIFDGYEVFTTDHLRVARPLRAPAAARRVEPFPPFNPATAPTHLRTAAEQ